MPPFLRPASGSLRIFFIIIALTALNKKCLSYCTDVVLSKSYLPPSAKSNYERNNYLPESLSETKDILQNAKHEQLKNTGNSPIDLTSIPRHSNILFPYPGSRFGNEENLAEEISPNQQQNDVSQYGALPPYFKQKATKKVFLSMGWGPGGQKTPKEKYLISQFNGKGSPEVSSPQNVLPQADGNRDYFLNPFVQSRMASWEKPKSEAFFDSGNRNFPMDDYTYQDDESSTISDVGPTATGPLTKTSLNKLESFGPEKVGPLNVQSLRKMQVPELLFRAYTMKKKLKELLQRPIRKPPVTVYPPTFGIGVHKVTHNFPFPNTLAFTDPGTERADGIGPKQRVNRHTDRERLLQMIKSLEKKYMLQLLQAESETIGAASEGGRGTWETEYPSQQTIATVLLPTGYTSKMTAGSLRKPLLLSPPRSPSLVTLSRSFVPPSKFVVSGQSSDGSPFLDDGRPGPGSPPGSSSHLSAANKGFHSIFTSGTWGPMG